MNARFVPLAGLAALLLLGGPSSAAAPDPALQQGMTSTRYLLGDWTCAHSVGDFSGTYTTRFTSALGGRWLRQLYQFPATATDPPWTAEFLMMYDARQTRWSRLGGLSTGISFGMVSRGDGHDGFLWLYTFPGASGATAKWTKVSDTVFTIEGPQYSENGKPVSERHRCTKAT